MEALCGREDHCILVAALDEDTVVGYIHLEDYQTLYMKIKEVMTSTGLTEKNIHYYEYGFSIGTMLILVGVITLVRASAM